MGSIGDAALSTVARTLQHCYNHGMKLGALSKTGLSYVNLLRCMVLSWPVKVLLYKDWAAWTGGGSGRACMPPETI